MTPWTKECWRLAGLITIAFIVGLIIDQITASLLVTVSAYLTWHLSNIHRLEKWFNRGGGKNPPQGHGIWLDIFDHLYHLQKQNRSRKKRLAGYLTRFKESTAAMPDATVVLNQHNQIEWINKAAQQLLKLKPAQDLGQHISNLVRAPAFVSYLAKRDYTHPLEITNPMDEQQNLSIQLIPYGQNQRLLIARDVTRLHRLEQMRRDFVANISHELRTPLTVLNGYIEAMNEEEVPAQWKNSVEAMTQQSARMQNIVNDLLTLSQLETDVIVREQGTVQVANMLALIRDDALALGSDKQQTIKLEIDENLLIQGIYNELYSAFSNLIFNAVRYTPEKGDITIRWYQDFMGAHLEIQDSGIGIAPKHIARLTERFYRVDIGRSRDSGGTGLGLAIVKHVLMRHGGQLRIQSQINKGSTFVCDFPESRIIISEPKSAAS